MITPALQDVATEFATLGGYAIGVYDWVPDSGYRCKGLATSLLKSQERLGKKEYGKCFSFKLNLQTRLPWGDITSLALQQKIIIGIDLAVKAAAQNNMNTIETEDKFGVTSCDRISLVIDKGLGTSVWDRDDKLYLDFTSGWGVTCLGHSI